MVDLDLQLPIGAHLECEDGRVCRVERFLGAGGTAQVFAARDQLGTLMAAKVLSGHRFEVNEEMRGRFRRESRVLGEVSSPNIIELEGLARWNDEPVMLLEYAEGGSVSKVLSRLPLPPLRVALRWLREALTGLAALHEADIVHRDISPKNLLIRGNGEIVVADFGTVRHIDDETLTHDQTHLGSLIYISPQQFESAHEATHSDDIYSLGQIAWQLLVGRRPFGNTAPLEDLRSDLLPELQALVERMRHHDDAQRPQNAGEALAELAGLTDALVKPALRRSNRVTEDGTRMHSPLSASVAAIETRQRNGLEILARKRGSDEVVATLDLMVSHLGPIRLNPPEETGIGIAPIEWKWSPRWLFSGSLKADVAAEESLRLLTLLNAVTGRTLSFALQEPHVIQDAPWPRLLGDLRQFDAWKAGDRAELFRIFDADQFKQGVLCGQCGNESATPLLLMHERAPSGSNRLSRAAVCPNEPEGYRCSICGEEFRAKGSSDEYGPYDAVGCGCPDYAYDVTFEQEPWKESVQLDQAGAVALLEAV